MKRLPILLIGFYKGFGTATAVGEIVIPSKARNLPLT